MVSFFSRKGTMGQNTYTEALLFRMTIFGDRRERLNEVIGDRPNLAGHLKY